MVPTIRKQIITLLREGPFTAMELSQYLSIQEKEVYDHLEHIGRSVKREGLILEVTPYQCFACGYVFDNRNRLQRPGRCPECKKSHIGMATFEITRL